MILYKVNSPIAVYLPRKTKKDRRIALNLNIWRNLHYIVSNQAKQAYRDLMKEHLDGLVFSEPIALTFVLFKQNKRQIDRSNVLCIVEKCFCDALTYYKCIPDDNDEFIISTSYFTGKLDKDNPRAEVYIKEGGPEWEHIKNNVTK
jgi:hypothetical protein